MLENALKEFLNFRNGFFIEVGAHDGIFQSNTLSLEKDLGWTGILIEPSISAYLDCVKNRPNSKCINTALTSFLKYEKKNLLMEILIVVPCQVLQVYDRGIQLFKI